MLCRPLSQVSYGVRLQGVGGSCGGIQKSSNSTKSFMLNKSFSPSLETSPEGTFYSILYEAGDCFPEPNLCEQAIDYTIQHLQETFGATLLNSERGDMMLVALLVDNQIVELQDDWGVGTVYLYASTREANSIVVRIAASLEGKLLAA